MGEIAPIEMVMEWRWVMKLAVHDCTTLKPKLIGFVSGAGAYEVPCVYGEVVNIVYVRVYHVLIGSVGGGSVGAETSLLVCA